MTTPATDTETKEGSVTSDSVFSSQPQSSISTDLRVIRRNGKVTPYDDSKIRIAMTKAFLAVEGGNAAASTRIHEIVDTMTLHITSAFQRRLPDGGTIHIEDIQDQVELCLMRDGEQKIARAYVLYREEHKKQRAAELIEEEETQESVSQIKVIPENGVAYSFDESRLKTIISESIKGLKDVSEELIFKTTRRNIFDGISENDLGEVIVMSARGLIDKDPNYSYVAARLLLDDVRRNALSFLYQRPMKITQADLAEDYSNCFEKTIERAAELDLVDTELTRYDLKKLGAAIEPERDQLFTYLSLQTLVDRYFIHSEEIRFELPQIFFMRVAMGLAINEIDREERTIEFYQLLSSFDFMSSTPTLFNSGTLRPQLSSCYLTTVPDDLDGIFSAIKDDAMLSKYAGGLGNDWTPVRGMGSRIKGTNGVSQGVVPFLKVANDTALAVNQGGKRKGAMCAYLETWHIDIEEFLDLRKNTGDDRRRTHDMNTANWIPDLFMERVIKEEVWTLFSPNETPDLHDLYGSEFRVQYEKYEAKAERGELQIFKTVKALDLWRKMLGMIFETGHPWITFKDPCNLRSPQQHVGVVHSSNLCTEITLNTSHDEIAVCNLGSVNLAQHTNENGVDMVKLEKTVSTAMRMLDNVIDYNFYSVQQARHSNMLHRPVGLGMMGFQDALHKVKLAYSTEEAVDFADKSMEAISYFAIKSSNKLAQERGCYPSYEGSLWSKGILPIDSIALLEEGRGNYVQMDKSSSLDWDTLRQDIMATGMRNSNTMAIAPTATISNICGVSQSIEPTYQNIYVKSNLSGEFTVVNHYLAEELKELGLWDDVMVNDIKYYEGSVQSVDRIPNEIKARYTTAFEMDSRWLIEAASRRQKWIDQGESLNLYLAEPSGKKLDSLYKLAWVRGLKTTYYLRSLGATAAETSAVASTQEAEELPKVCSILDPDCDACQ